MLIFIYHDLSIKGSIGTVIIFNEIISNKEKLIDYINKNNIDVFYNKKDLLSVEDFAVKNIAERNNIDESIEIIFFIL